MEQCKPLEGGEEIREARQRRQIINRDVIHGRASPQGLPLPAGSTAGGSRRPDRSERGRVVQLEPGFDPGFAQLVTIYFLAVAPFQYLRRSRLNVLK